MAFQNIVASIDAYIASLKAARELLARLNLPSETIDKLTIKRKYREKPQAVQVSVPPPSFGSCSPNCASPSAAPTTTSGKV
jgi:hypothetical protein